MNLKFWKRTPEPLPVAVMPKIRHVWGIPEKVMPIRGIDAKAQAKVVLRDQQYAELVMLTDTQDSSFMLEDRGEYWIVDKEIRREVIVK